MCTPMFVAVLFTMVKTGATRVSVNRQVGKKAVAHLRNGILLSHKKEWNLTICNSTDGLEGIVLSEVTQSEKNKCQMISLICGI